MASGHFPLSFLLEYFPGYEHFPNVKRLASDVSRVWVRVGVGNMARRFCHVWTERRTAAVLTVWHSQD